MHAALVRLGELARHFAGRRASASRLLRSRTVTMALSRVSTKGAMIVLKSAEPGGGMNGRMRSMPCRAALFLMKRMRCETLTQLMRVARKPFASGVRATSAAICSGDA